ncbi:MAG: hypothetical protein RMZ41_010330 [Nostoc sp. DedVER02]|uniref:hypothetical protein n=1 Tax=unclassified Nostoc TaxID=2593658 RepID=UPI002AD226B0|nr:MULTISPECIES: hypothetical protein [unclassified Nostoc]MDZ7986364.1 hypothetical protein [Nostoc sp. DedVER02]MDZ8112754.1 hypothetical protein [Nostoc sp. DedVER01b]
MNLIRYILQYDKDTPMRSISMPAQKNYITFGLTKDNGNNMSQAQRHLTVLQITTGNSEIN